MSTKTSPVLSTLLFATACATGAAACADDPEVGTSAEDIIGGVPATPMIGTITAIATAVAPATMRRPSDRKDNVTSIPSNIEKHIALARGTGLWSTDR